MSSSLERLKAAAAKAPAAPTTSAPAASTPAPSAPAAPVTPAATAPAPTPPAATAPAPQPSTPASNAPAVSTPAASAPALVVPVSVETDDEARAALALLHGTVEGDDGASPADVFDELDNAGGLAFSHPFAQVRKGNWDVHKSCPTSIVDFMPAGKRAFNMIYLGYRIGAIGWPCTGGATPGGAPPLYKFAIPHRRMFPQSTEMTRQTLLYGSKIQYKRVNEEKYKHLGKLTPETHIFGWTPDIGFMVLSVQGFSPSELTTGGLSAKTARDMEGQGPLCFTIEAEVTINNKVPVDAKNHKWTDYWIKGEFMPTEAKSTALYEAWEKMKATSIKEVANQTIMFHKALDYKGLSAEEISKKLAQYAAAIG